MLLSGNEILHVIQRTAAWEASGEFDPAKLLHRPAISITPFDRSALNPHSYNLRLGPTLVTYARTSGELDMRLDNPTSEHVIGPDGVVLRPGVVYLGSTVERVAAYGLAAKIDGRSSVGRLGLLVHLTAGYVDSGFDGHYTLELSVTEPLRVYAGVAICQVSFEMIAGDVSDYAGKYNNQGPRPVSSRLWKELAASPSVSTPTTKEQP